MPEVYDPYDHGVLVAAQIAGVVCRSFLGRAEHEDKVVRATKYFPVDDHHSVLFIAEIARIKGIR